MSKRVDKNHREICDFIGAIPGITILDTHELGKGAPDICVGFMKQDYWIEIKSDNGKPNEGQVRWHSWWNGRPVHVVHNVADVIDVLGIV